VLPRVGVDVTAVERVQRAHTRHGDRFLSRFLTRREIAYCAGKPERWAGRWAAKEAIGKAMPSGVLRPSMKEVEILPAADGRPEVVAARATALSGRRVDVSIAHDGRFAVAVAVIPDLDPSASPAAALPPGFRLPDRPRDGHKGTFGTVAVVAGSRGFTGAAYLAAMGAARSGAGLVRLLVGESIYPILAVKCTEVMATPLIESSPGILGEASVEGVLRGFQGAKAGVVGPGLGRERSTWLLLDRVLPRAEMPLVLDADALNLLSEHPDRLAGLPAATVLTPHPAEFGRLSGLETRAVQGDRSGLAVRFARTWNKTVVLKGAGTVVASPDGRLYVSPVATPALATGGTGDVLAGLIGGLLAQGLTPHEAAVTAVTVHELAGLRLESALGPAGSLAGDLLPEIPAVMMQLRALSR
jgi:holo-[acyl-carrier-protein] synthase